MIAQVSALPPSYSSSTVVRTRRVFTEDGKIPVPAEIGFLDWLIGSPGPLKAFSFVERDEKRQQLILEKFRTMFPDRIIPDPGKSLNQHEL